MESSPELQELTRHLARAIGEGDAAFFADHTARQAAVAFLGTDPTEWWTDVPSLLPVLLAQHEAGIRVVRGEPLAYAEGDVGWAVDRDLHFQVGDVEIPFRLSVVYHREDGAWRMVHVHTSIGVPNEDVLGGELPFS